MVPLGFTWTMWPSSWNPTSRRTSWTPYELQWAPSSTWLTTWPFTDFCQSAVPRTKCTTYWMSIGTHGTYGTNLLGPNQFSRTTWPKSRHPTRTHWKLVQWTSSSSTCIWTTSRLAATTFNVGTTKSIWRQPQVNPPTTQTQWSGPQQDQGQGAPWNPTMGQPQAVPQQVPQWAESTSSNFLDTFMWTTSCASFPTHPA